MDRMMKYHSVKGIRVEWNGAELIEFDKEIVLDEPWEYCKIELVRGFGNVAIYINDAEIDEYIYMDNNTNVIELQDIAIKKIKFRGIKDTTCYNLIQVTLMR